MLKGLIAAIAFACLTAVPADAGEVTSAVKGAIQDIVIQQANAYGVSPSLALALVQVESGFDARATGDAGEQGLGQIRCQSARYFGFTGKCSMLYHVATNLRYSMLYLKRALVLARGDQCGALSRYNAGLFSKKIRQDYCDLVKAAMK